MSCWGSFRSRIRENHTPSHFEHLNFPSFVEPAAGRTEVLFSGLFSSGRVLSVVVAFDGEEEEAKDTFVLAVDAGADTNSTNSFRTSSLQVVINPAFAKGAVEFTSVPLDDDCFGTDLGDLPPTK